ncbi:MAG: SDR family oxidoreductase [Actinomycetaceae bacterium]|nr:SDR family oxidoreductase [Actinomycetaceae bacterium]
MHNNTSLDGKVAIITGAGSGIGKASAHLFLSRGAKVVAADLKPESVEALSNEWPEFAENIRPFSVNVANKEQVEAMIDFAVEEFGKLDILFNNAGIMDGMVPLGKVDDSAWSLAFDVNVNGVMYAMRKAINYFLERGEGGVVVNTASVGGLNGGRAGAAYTASKHAVIGMTKAAAFEYAPQGIRCVALAPGGVVTNIGIGANADMDMYEQMKPGLALMRGGAAQPEQLAEAAAFLASDAASFVNGSVLTADGGWTSY